MCHLHREINLCYVNLHLIERDQFLAQIKLRYKLRERKYTIYVHSRKIEKLFAGETDRKAKIW